MRTCMDGRFAFLFPGQDSQQVGMGLDLYRRFPVVRETFREASDLLELPVEELCFRGPPSELHKTEHGQPAVFGLVRSEEHTSELQSRPHLVCRLLLEKKKPFELE